MNRYILAVVGVLLAVTAVVLVAAGVWYAVTDEADRDEQLVDWGLKSADDVLEGSGFIEATMVDLASELGGRVVVVHHGEGDPVSRGAVLLELEDQALLAERDQAEAALAAAEAGLAGLQEGARPQQLRQAELAVVQADEAASAAERRYREAQAALDERRALSAGVSAAEAELAAAEERLRGAETLFDAAAETRDALEASGAGSAELAEARAAWWDAWAARESARIGVSAAEGKLESARQREEGPQELQMAADAAQTEYEVALADLELAVARLDSVEAGPDDTDVALAEAAVGQARAHFSGTEAKLELLQIRSPIDGFVADLPVSAGEFVGAGRLLARVGNISEVTLTVYAPTGEMDRLDVGQAAEVTVDAVEDEVFDGEVVTLAQTAEFTPKNVQTKDERANLVYAVKIRVENPDELLKPGMPADAKIDLD